MGVGTSSRMNAWGKEVSFTFKYGTLDQNSKWAFTASAVEFLQLVPGVEPTQDVDVEGTTRHFRS